MYISATMIFESRVLLVSRTYTLVWFFLSNTFFVALVRIGGRNGTPQWLASRWTVPLSTVRSWPGLTSMCSLTASGVATSSPPLQLPHHPLPSHFLTHSVPVHSQSCIFSPFYSFKNVEKSAYSIQVTAGYRIRYDNVLLVQQ